MNAEEQLQQFREHALTALKKIPHSRWYAIDENALDSLAFLGIAWLEKRVEDGLRFNVEEFQKMIAELVALTPSLQQERPEKPPELPEVWKDSISGQIARNPFAEPIDLESQAAVTKHDGQLAKHLKAIAEGVTYKLLAEQRDQETKRARIAAIVYSDSEHLTNPHVTGDLQAAGRLARDNPELSDYYKKESRPVALPWQLGANNLTAVGVLTKNAPHIAAFANRAAELQRQRVAEKIETAKAAEVSASKARQQAEALLHGR
ncbi:MAG: hypothetical protein QOH39_2764 [Verrucomicrobiota bacterium]